MILYGFIVIKKWMDCQENILNVSRYNYIFIGYSGHKKNTTCWRTGRIFVFPLFCFSCSDYITKLEKMDRKIGL